METYELRVKNRGTKEETYMGKICVEDGQLVESGCKFTGTRVPAHLEFRNKKPVIVTDFDGLMGIVTEIPTN